MREMIMRDIRYHCGQAYYVSQVEYSGYRTIDHLSAAVLLWSLLDS